MQNSFANRHIGIRNDEVPTMLSEIGNKTIDELVSQTIPHSILKSDELKVDKAVNENDYLKHLEQLANKNTLNDNYIGQGYYGTIIPNVIKRNILCNPGWYTAYTPYQAEIAQGRLEALLNFQTMITELTGMELANASLLDESTAAAEAMLMLFHMRSRDQQKRNVNKFFLSEGLFEQNKEVILARAEPLGIEVVIENPESIQFSDEFFGAIVQYPDAYGEIHDYSGFVEKAKQFQIPVAAIADIMSLVLLKSPASWGADVVVGSTQRFGVPMGYGGPHAAYFACGEEHKRFIPGRIIGVSLDSNGNPALRMALQTREQHIKRGRATSNICTAQALLAVMAGMYAVYHGPEGLKEIATEISIKSNSLRICLEKMGLNVLNSEQFDTITIQRNNENWENLMIENGVNLFYRSDNFSISIDETTTWSD